MPSVIFCSHHRLQLLHKMAASPTNGTPLRTVYLSAGSHRRPADGGKEGFWPKYGLGKTVTVSDGAADTVAVAVAVADADADADADAVVVVAEAVGVASTVVVVVSTDAEEAAGFTTVGVLPTPPAPPLEPPPCCRRCLLTLGRVLRDLAVGVWVITVLALDIEVDVLLEK